MSSWWLLKIWSSLHTPEAWILSVVQLPQLRSDSTIWVFILILYRCHWITTVAHWGPTRILLWYTIGINFHSDLFGATSLEFLWVFKILCQSKHTTKTTCYTLLCLLTQPPHFLLPLSPTSPPPALLPLLPIFWSSYSWWSFKLLTVYVFSADADNSATLKTMKWWPSQFLLTVFF